MCRRLSFIHGYPYMKMRERHPPLGRLTGLALLLLLPLAAHGQYSSDYVSWTLSVEPATAHPGQTARATLQATIAKGWKMYALDSPAGQPLAVAFENVGKGICLGEMKQADPAVGYDPNFQDTVRYFQDEARLWAAVNVARDAAAGPHEIQGTVTFMICTEEMCLPPTTKTLTTSLRVEQTGKK